MSDRVLAVIAARCERTAGRPPLTHQCAQPTRYVVNGPHGPVRDCGQHNP